MLSAFWIIIAGLVAIASAFAMGLFGGNKMPVEGKTVLITGASEGMGLSVACQLAAKAANVVIVARSVGKLEEAIAKIKSAAKNPETQRFHSISADVAAPAYAGPLLAEVIAWNDGHPPDIVWCVAGLAIPGIFAERPIENLRHMMNVNFFGHAEMAHAIINEWCSPTAPVDADRPKHLIMTTSVTAFFPMIGYGPYTPSKVAVRALADTLSQEVLLYPQDVRVHLVCPGTILTSGYDREEKVKPEITKMLEESDPKQTPDEVAARSIAGLERGDYLITVNWLGALMKSGSLAGSFRNNWVLDTIMAWLASLIFMFVLPDFVGKITRYGKQNGHPRTWSS